MRLILIRHGQTVSNVGGLLDTAHPGADLTPLGREQAGNLVAALATVTIDALYVSTLVRTQQTAEPLAVARGLEARVRGDIREVSAGHLEGRHDRAAVDAYCTTFLAWANGDLDTVMPGGESGRDTFARFDRVVTEADDLGLETVAFVSHGAILRAWTGYSCSNLHAGYVTDNQLSNTGTIVVTGSPLEGWTAESWIGSMLPVGQGSAANASGPAGQPGLLAERGF
ncbi:phosphoglycerate mutase family protein [Cryobacterium breve]|uniref:Phosphoglycerate mutase family protein n=1 Tax=Cryobacterium breve TaxID=1259258 RepID=A0ABY7NFK3_9MICO|nr:histidine phosphatase family protein [Cryobacterium breve]WBM81302.1 phosphoglycerate mutase family protein [Cryobacterium breve]